ncbi:hypothetical protein [Pseudomonas syringae]|uniref:Uncharacterized protein n=1 Tax=Pseudomonas syringae pv. actinidiae TaxID=103796 RepID=A0A2P0QF59_PSESF|nr:hypothetical protein [Pseudomonas syringae]APQ06941.1 hypothetical protein PsaNZ47_29805 [Pseudomonas syringae pv. actinidiae]ARO44913.1 hypothetical protein [Pseudomonas syringae pv. actinidiae]ARO45014.1 hypothetical protein [Pseudomonas syringae pv. actinidiae]ARO45108.1 hypothetical protein [Pseudomonas syringae pv. actinidiae]MDU8389552.1 hypothetical protein [Pseudomonas syringae pv. actinidiae]
MKQPRDSRSDQDTPEDWGSRNVKCFQYIALAFMFILTPILIGMLDQPIPGWMLWLSPFSAAFAFLMAGFTRSELVPEAVYLALACYAIAACSVLVGMYTIMFS